MIEIMCIIKLICFNWLLVNAEPIILFRTYIGFNELEYDNWNKYKRFIFRLITCEICLGFWVGLLFTFNPFTAAVVSVGSGIINKIIKNNMKL